MVLKETTDVRVLAGLDDVAPTQRALQSAADAAAAAALSASTDLVARPASAARTRFTWRIENFTTFKEIMETRKIFSKYFPAPGGCDLRIGVYESFDMLCVYIEADAAGDRERGGDGNWWVKYRMALLNLRHPERSEWRESAICTKTWNNSVLQFLKVGG